jgi:preprotein translocase subunit Sec63
VSFLDTVCVLDKAEMFQLNRLKFLFTLRRFSLSASSSASRDLYSTLGVNRNASAKEIKSAFYELSKKYHPDRNPDNKEAAVVKFQDVSF